MNIMHRISFNSKQHDMYNYFEKMGFKINSGILSTFDVGENDKRWVDISKVISCHPLDILDVQFETRFTKIEMEKAFFFAISPIWHFEYPQPTDDLAYKAITYDSTKICSKCGVEQKQIASFSIKKNPKWGKRNIVQLNWIFDEYFVSGVLKSQLENECIRFKFRFVNKYLTNDRLDDIFQLDIDRTIDLDMSTETIFARCNVCNQIKYLPHTKGFFPHPKDVDFTIAYSKQYFGRGNNAHHAVLINKNVYVLFKKLGVNGISYIPVIPTNYL